MPYITPTNRKFCLNCDIADALLMRQNDYPCEKYDEPYYNPVDKKYQTKFEILKNFWLGCEQTPGCGDGMRETTSPYEAWLGIDKFYLENLFKYPVTPNDLPYNEPQFIYTDEQWVQYKDIFGVKYHFTINGELSDSWTTSYYKQTNKNSLPRPNESNKNFVVTSFKNRYKSTYTDDYDVAKQNAPEGCEHYDRFDDETRTIYHHGIRPLNLMYKVGTSWVQDSFTSSESPFVATATPKNYIIPSSENSTIYDTDITFSLPEYSGLTHVDYVWNIRQIESGLTLKAYLRQNKKTGTVRFIDGNDIILKGIGSYGSKGVIPSKGIIYTGDYNDGVNDTISWYNKTNNLTPSTGDFTDEAHADSKGLNDNVTITSNQSWCHDIVYNINNLTAYVDWWKDGEGKGSRTATITINKKDPRLDVVTPYQFNIIQNAPVPKYCYYFEGLTANNLSCYGGTVNANVRTSIKKKYHDYSICDDNVDDYYVGTYNVGWTFSPQTIGMNTSCSNKTHVITATQNESGLQLATTITQSYDCEHHDYINNCRANPSSIGSGGGSGSISANAWYYDRTCTVNYDNSTYSPTSFSFGANTDQTPKTHAITVCNAGTACCTVYVQQDGAPVPSGCHPNSGYSISASVNKSSVSCDGGTVTVTVDTFKKDGDGGGDVSWTVTPGGATGTGSGSATVEIGSTTTDKTTTITVSGEAGYCEFTVSQSGCEPEPTGCTISVSPTSGTAPCDSTSTKSVTVTSSDSWTSSTSGGLSVSPSSGNSGTTNVTISVPTGTTDGKVTFSCGSDSASYSLDRDGSGCSGGGTGGDCSCDCTILVHTNENVNSFPSSGGTVTIYVWQSCKDCKPVSWKASSNCSWVKITQGSTGNGVCCDTYNCNDPSYGETEQSCLPSANICKVEVEANTGEQRNCNITFTQTGEGCSKSTVVGITQLKSNEPTGCTDCYVAFKNSRTVNMESSGGTLNNEGIVQHGNGTNCDVEVKNFTITSTDGNTSGISVSPSSGDITSCNITVPENTSTSDRTIVITIHPNIDERSTDNCKN